MLSRGWHTDLAILLQQGAAVVERPDHLVVTTPSNPLYHWGNLVIVTDPAAVDDADRWVSTFAAAHPGAGHLAIGLPVIPDTKAWAVRGIEILTDEVLFTDRMPEVRPLDPRYTSHPLTTDAQWASVIARNCAENERSGDYEPLSHERFLRNQVADRRLLIERGFAQWFGAFAEDGSLVSDLGIVDCGSGLARYQSVETDAAHRGHGLASHLLGQAARWAAHRGCREWAIVTETTNPAGRLYRSLGFKPDAVQVRAYRTS